MFGVMGSIRAVIIVNTEVVKWCFLFVVRHFSVISVVCGGRVIDDMYISRMYTYRLSSEVIAIKVASAIMLREVKLFIMSHFGMNPERGGNPPRDRMVVARATVINGEFVHAAPMSLIVVEDVVLISINVGVVARA